MKNRSRNYLTQFNIFILASYITLIAIIIINAFNKKDTSENNIIKQYVELISTEGVILNFSVEAISEVALIATRVNDEVENIGARRLHTILEKILEDISFSASDTKSNKIDIDKKYVVDQIGDIYKDTDLTKFFL